MRSHKFLPSSIRSSLFKGGRQRFKYFLINAWVLFLVSIPITSISQEKLETHKPEEIVVSDLHKIKQQLLKITKKQITLSGELDKLKKAVQNKETTDRIEELRSERTELNINFEALASQIHEAELFKNEGSGMNWLDELQELTMPLLKAIHEISEKPRKVDRLKTKIQTLKLQYSRYTEAIKNLDDLMKLEDGNSSTDQKVLQSYYKQLNKFTAKYNPELLQLRLDEAERSLEKIQNTDVSILSVIKESLGNFFRERGRNLFIASITFLGLWWVLLAIYKVINSRPVILSKLNPQLRRLIKTIANLFIVIISFLASLISLYLLDDWLLLSIAILFIMALAWTSRQLIPNIMKELRIIMNLGTVREGERIIWKGVPFLVKEIGLYATLINEQLEGGVLRMPVGELVGQHSRPVVDSEPWFPTKQKDYVILDDGIYGRVESQTMEQVTLYNIGSLKYYPTADFISQKPRNLSKGYRLIIKFGFDYGVQSRICDEIPKMFEEGLKKYLIKYYEKEPPAITSLHAYFDEAGASSLNLIFLVTIDGAYAEDYYPFKWMINKYLVQICNDNGLVIPFTQLTVNLSDDLKEFASQQGKLNQ
ncbi:MAG: hypothetical protein ACQ9MH_15260 [Nitrospinales bacterium]